MSKENKLLKTLLWLEKHSLFFRMVLWVYAKFYQVYYLVRLSDAERFCRKHSPSDFRYLDEELPPMVFLERADLPDPTNTLRELEEVCVSSEREYQHHFLSNPASIILEITDYYFFKDASCLVVLSSTTQK